MDVVENRAQRLRNLSQARRRERRRRRAARGEEPARAEVAQIGLARVKLGARYRFRGGLEFRVVRIDWSKSDPPVPEQVCIQCGVSLRTGPARLLLQDSVEYLGQGVEVNNGEG